MFFNVTYANQYLKLRIAHKLPVTYIAVTDFQLNRVRENMERISVTEHRRNPLSRWTKLPPAHGNPARLGDLPHDSETPDEMLMRSQRIQQLDRSVQQLPNRQRQAFMLRCWEGLSTIETAIAMEISEGSVKTHYSRAMHALRDMLEDYRHD